MTISGDCAASLVSHFNLSFEEANSIVKDVIETCADANFALRYAHDETRMEGLPDDKAMWYWDVIEFLKQTQVLR